MVGQVGSGSEVEPLVGGGDVEETLDFVLYVFDGGPCFYRDGTFLRLLLTAIVMTAIAIAMVGEDAAGKVFHKETEVWPRETVVPWSCQFRVGAYCHIDNNIDKDLDDTDSDSDTIFSRCSRCSLSILILVLISIFVLLLLVGLVVMVVGKRLEIMKRAS